MFYISSDTYHQYALPLNQIYKIYDTYNEHTPDLIVLAESESIETTLNFLSSKRMLWILPSKRYFKVLTEH